ncbi:DUF2188 domain-containing protein [Herbidospora sp. NEAU-GS84]|uniref:DUF2188 domain-containing protein n=1 Tax=Herbidospora solisilvae TaxID=2696284 RepID=A0A7C9J1U9_9ACTN|nr:DUF2188 domain-containing protein [Herbidospora solisilvae]NAS22162.1 DUF2188 domain-containing protein [Herbidospora solisilvae]
MARKIYRVVPAASQWQVKKDGNVLATFNLKTDAVSHGQQLAKANMPSQLVIYLKDGTIEKEYTYGSDPYPPAG